MTSRAVVVCDSVHDYVASALHADEVAHRLGRSFIPLLAGAPDDRRVRFALEGEPLDYIPFGECGAPASDLPEDLLAAVVRAAGERAPSGPLWAVAGASAWGLIGAAHALIRGRRCVVVDLSEAASSEVAPSLALVLSPKECQAIGCDNLKALATGVVRGGPWGLLTASSPARLSNLLARIALRPREARLTAAVFEQEDCAAPTPAVVDLEREVMPWHPYGGAARLASSGVGFAAFVGHGRPYCGMSGNLCSRTDAAEAGDLRCSGEFECVFGKHRRVPARDLRMDAVFLASCSTSAFRSPGPQEAEALNLGVHLLDGFASAVVGPYRTSTPVAAAPYLAWDRIRSGASAGEVTAAVNALSVSRLGCAEPYVLFGDPELVFTEARAAPILVPVQARSPGGWQIVLERAPNRVAGYRICDRALAEAVRSRPIHAVSEQPSADDRFDVLWAGGGDLVELLVVWSGASAGAVRVHLTEAPPIRPEVVAIATDILERQRLYGAWLERPLEGDGGEPHPMRALAEELRALEWAIAERGPISASSMFLQRYRRDQQLLALGERAQLDLLLRLRSAAMRRSLWLFKELADTAAVRPLGNEVEAEPCPYCGGLVISHVTEVGVWPRQKRRLLECERCMFICDIEDGAAPLRMECAEAAERGSALAVEVVGRNLLDRRALVHASVTVDTIASGLEQGAVDPDVRGVTAGASEEFRLPFQVRLGPALAAHLYYLKALVFVNGSVSWAMRKVTVRAQGQIPV